MGESFCCAGCQAVHSLLNNTPLQLVHSPKASQRNWNYLDNDSILGEYVASSNPQLLFLSVEGIECTSCVELLYRLPDFVSDLDTIEVDVSRSLLKVQKSEPGAFSKVAEAIERLGYRVEPLLLEDYDKQNNSQHLKKLRNQFAIAAACAGNIMLLAVSAYAGMPEDLELIFHWISGLLILPVLYYSARPFWVNALRAYKQKRVNMDVPIALTLAFGSIFSFFNLVRGSSNVYFDSIAMLVFLLLGSRLLLVSIRKHFIGSSQLTDRLKNQMVKVIQNGSPKIVPSGDLKKKDIFSLSLDQTFPVNCKVEQGSGFIDPSLLTGESLPKVFNVGDVIQAGMRLRSGEAGLFSVVSEFNQSELYNYISNVDRQVKKPSLMSFATDRAAKIFTLAILCLGLGVIVLGPLIFSLSIEEALFRGLALFVVACPCGLAFAIPLIESLGLNRAAKANIYIRGADVFEKINQSSHVFFDKTGTLTKGHHSFFKFLFGKPNKKQIANIFALESPSQHPLARSYVNHFYSSVEQLPYVANWEEMPGQGISGVIDGIKVSIRKLMPGENPISSEDAAEFQLQQNVGYFEDDKLVTILTFKDEWHEQVKPLVDALKADHKTVSLLSGDVSDNLIEFANILSVEAVGDLGPDEKRQMVAKTSHSIMIGDGFNDMSALKEAGLGVAVQGSLPENLKHVDVLVDREGVRGIADLFSLARQVRTSNKSVLTFSGLYNIALGGLALTGFINPLAAAIFMPLSSISVLLLSLYFMRKHKENPKALDKGSLSVGPQLTPVGGHG
tara:strand:- start:62675 stop:65029 length:2355 start_codon:yes stop_codon:yes gene_type:complete